METQGIFAVWAKHAGAPHMAAHRGKGDEFALKLGAVGD